MPFDPLASKAINAGKSLADFPCPARDALKKVYENTMALLNSVHKNR